MSEANPGIPRRRRSAQVSSCITDRWRGIAGRAWRRSAMDCKTAPAWREVLQQLLPRSVLYAGPTPRHLCRHVRLRGDTAGVLLRRRSSSLLNGASVQLCQVLEFLRRLRALLASRTRLTQPISLNRLGIAAEVVGTRCGLVNAAGFRLSEYDTHRPCRRVSRTFVPWRPTQLRVRDGVLVRTAGLAVSRPGNETSTASGREL